jgi:hypothetical protein
VAERLPDRLDLLRTFAISPGPIPGAILRVVEDQRGPRMNRAAGNLRSRESPRFAEAAPLSTPDDADPVAAIIAAVRAMEGTVLPVQGPPGTGKNTSPTVEHIRLVNGLCALPIRAMESSMGEDEMGNPGSETPAR